MATLPDAFLSTVVQKDPTHHSVKKLIQRGLKAGPNPIRMHPFVLGRTCRIAVHAGPRGYTPPLWVLLTLPLLLIPAPWGRRNGVAATAPPGVRGWEG